MEHKGMKHTVLGRFLSASLWREKLKFWNWPLMTFWCWKCPNHVSFLLSVTSPKSTTCNPRRPTFHTGNLTVASKSGPSGTQRVYLFDSEHKLSPKSKNAPRDPPMKFNLPTFGDIRYSPRLPDLSHFRSTWLQVSRKSWTRHCGFDPRIDYIFFNREKCCRTVKS